MSRASTHASKDCRNGFTVASPQVRLPRVKPIGSGTGLNQARFREARFKADGRLTMREGARLHQMLDRESANIYRAKHNRVHW